MVVKLTDQQHRRFLGHEINFRFKFTDDDGFVEPGTSGEILIMDQIFLVINKKPVKYEMIYKKDDKWVSTGIMGNVN